MVDVVRVTGVRRRSADVVELTLEDPDGRPLPGWSAGAHIDLHVTASGTSGPLIRQYSLTGDSTDRARYRVAVLREPAGRGGSAAIHDHLRAGQLLTIAGPRNHFPLLASPRYLFIAGGIGITPILPMITEAERAGADWRLVYGGRTRASMVYLDRLAQLGARSAERSRMLPQDECGLLPLAELLDEPVADTLVYCCGPAALIDAVTERTVRWPPRTLHVERFAPIGAQPGRFDRPFRIALARTGRTLEVPPGRSILDVLEAAGVPVLSSCREGTCGTCETALLAGEADHRDAVLSPEEQDDQDAMMVCVSRSRTDELVLDL